MCYNCVITVIIVFLWFAVCRGQPKSESNPDLTNFSLGTRQISSLSTCCEIAFMWMLQNFANANSTLGQVMAWCRQAASHYLSQCLNQI